MAFVVTYTTLTAEIQEYVERTDARFIDSIPLFILLGQRRLSRDLKILQSKQFVTSNLLVSNQVLVKPGDWLNSSTFNIGTSTNFSTRVQIEQRSLEYCRLYWPDPTQLGQPKYYADYDYNTWLIVPTPDVAYPYEVGYYCLPPLLDETNGTNIYTAVCPEPLFYSCMLETASFLKDDERVPIWAQYYETSKKTVSDEDVRRIYDGFSKRGG